MKKDIFISIIVPIYNVEDFLPFCIDSIIRQNIEKKIEIILINDASTDNSLNIIREYEKKDSRIKIINLETNGGPGKARNTGLNDAVGKYVLFVDSDDWLTSKCLTHLLNKTDKIDYDIISFGFTISEQNNIKARKDTIPRGVENNISYFRDVLLTSNGFSPMVWSYLFSRKFLVKSKLFFTTEGYFEDVPFTTIALFKCKKIGTINETLYNYRYRPSSITHSNSKKKIDDSFKTHFMIKEFLEGEKVFDKYKDEFIIRLLSCCIAPCFKDYMKMKKTDKELQSFMTQVRKSNLLCSNNLFLLATDFKENKKRGLKDEALFVKKAYDFLFVVRNYYRLLCFSIFLRRLILRPN